MTSQKNTYPTAFYDKEKGRALFEEEKRDVPSPPSSVGVLTGGLVRDDNVESGSWGEEVISCALDLWKWRNPVYLLRMDRGLTRKDYSAYAGLSAARIWSVENGDTNVKLSNLIGLARGLRVTVGALANKLDRWLCEYPCGSVEEAVAYVEKWGGLE